MKVVSLKEQKLLSSFLFLVQNTLYVENKFQAFFNQAIRSIVSALEAKDVYTYGHSLRTAEYSVLIGRALKSSENDLIKLELSGLLHDIGKIGTPDHILLKPGRLTKEEFEIMKEHPLKSVEIISHIKLLEDVIPIVKHHQERMDGLGYPDGLKGEEIPLLSRIVYIADAFDAMTSDRPYRKALSQKTAYEELLRCSGTQFDASLVKVFIEEHQKKKHFPRELQIFPLRTKRKAVGE